MTSSQLVLWLHDTATSSQDVILHPTCAAAHGFLQDDILLVQSATSKTDSQGSGRLDSGHEAVPDGLVFRIGEPDRALVERQPQLQISMNQVVAQAFGFSNRDQVLVSKLPTPLPRKYTGSHVEIFFKDTYLGRADMLRTSLFLVNQCIWVGQKLILPGSGIRVRVGEIWIKGKKRRSAYVCATTKIVYRSLSARVYLFVQISSECWNFDVDGSLFHEKMVELFLPELFRRWQAHSTNHAVSLILFSRVLYDDHEVPLLTHGSALSTDPLGRKCLDVYKALLNLEVGISWAKVVETLRVELDRFQKSLLLEYSPRVDGALAGRISAAHEGNVLEALNLASKQFEKRYMERDLQRTGMTIILITAGTGHFHVDKNLLRLTSERFVDLGLTVDCVSCAKCPLHEVPIFSYSSQDPFSHDAKAELSRKAAQPLRIGNRKANAESLSVVLNPPRTNKGRSALIEDLDPLYQDSANSDGPLKRFFAVPEFLDAAFYSRQPDRPFRIDRFMTRCKMPQIEMLGTAAGENASISLPLLRHSSEYKESDRARRAKLREEADNLACGGNRRGSVKVKRHLQPEQHLAPPKRDQGIARGAANHVLRPQSSLSSLREAPRKSMLATNAVSKEEEEPVARGRHASIQSSMSATSSRAPSLAPSQKASFTPALLARISAQAKAPSSTTSSIATPAIMAKPAQGHWFDIFKGSMTSKTKATPSQSTTNTPTTMTPAPTPKVVERPLPNPDIANPQAPPVPPPAPAVPISISNAPQPLENSLGPPLRNLESSPAPTVVEEKSRENPKLHKKQPSFLLDPSNPTRKKEFSRAQHQRWRKPSDQRSVKWKSLCSPALLPLTTDWCPSSAELESCYSSGSYSMSVAPASATLFVRAYEKQEHQVAACLREMVYHRLQQGFQLINAPRNPADRLPNMASSSDILSILYWTAGAGKAIYMAYARHVHRLVYNTNRQQIDVTVYVREQYFSKDHFPHSFIICPRYTDQYKTWETTFNYTDRDEDCLDFPYIDGAITGSQPLTKLKDGLHYIRARFIIVPCPFRDRDAVVSSNNDGLDEGSTDEDIRLTGIVKLFTHFGSQRWTNPINTAGNSSYKFTPHLLPSKHVREELAALKEEELLDATTVVPSQPLAGRTLEEVARAMQKEEQGLQMETKRWHLRNYPNSFTGSEFIDWLIQTYSDVNHQDEALVQGKKLQDKGLFAPAGPQRTLVNGPHFFTLSPNYCPNEGASEWFRREDLDLQTSKSSPDHDGLPDLPLPHEEPKDPKYRIAMSDSLLIDLDDKNKSDRAEIVQLHKDLVHNPSGCFHFQLNWLSTSQLVDELTRAYARMIDRYGLRLVFCAALQAKDLVERCPLDQYLTIKLACSPPKREAGEDPEATEHRLLNKFGYLMGIIEADQRFPAELKVSYSYRKTPCTQTQFIHQSGAALVQILPHNEGFIFLPNRLYLTHPFGKTATPPEDLYQELSTFCQNERLLTAFYEQATRDMDEAAEEDMY